MIPIGTHVKVKLPAKYAYNMQHAVVISKTAKNDYVVHLNRPVFVKCIGKYLSIMSVSPERVLYSVR